MRTAYPPLAALALAAAGCGNPSVVPVSGRVTLDGQPVANAKLLFSPHHPGNPNPGLGSYGRTNADGWYSLQLVDRSASGALIGPHTVELSAAPAPKGQGGEAEAGKDVIPSRYHAGILRFEVPPGGTREADFALTTQADDGPRQPGRRANSRKGTP